MTWLPTLDDKSREILLPLSGGTAGALLRVLLDEEHDSSLLARHLLVDPLAVRWLRCQVPRLRSSASLTELSFQLDRASLQSALHSLTEQEPGRGPIATDYHRGEHLAFSAGTHICRTASSVREACQSHRVLALLLQHAETWDTQRDADDLGPSRRTRDWTNSLWQARLHDESRLGRVLHRRIQLAWRPDGGTAARRLLTLHRHLWRLEQLEQKFAFQLEQSKLAALKEFAYGASHEINNPLTNIAARAQLLLRQGRMPDEGKALQIIHQQAMRAFQMIADLALFAKPPAIRPERILVESLLQDLVKKVLRDAAVRSPQLEVSMRASKSLGWIDADRTQLIVAMDALCQNAMEAMGERGTLSLVAAGGCDRRGRPELRLRVRDSGPGIPAEVLPHIFDPFYSGREAGRGLGFGLCTAWRIVTDHGGHIWPDAAPRRGCRFTICLPHYVPRA